MTRTDIHRPSAIDPTQYQFVAYEFLKVEGLGDAQFLQTCRTTIREHMARTGGTYSDHSHGGNCMVCGSVNAIYTVLFYHQASNTYVRMGTDCAEKCNMAFSLYEANAFKRRVQDALEAHAGKRKAKAVLENAGLAQAWAIYENPPVNPVAANVTELPEAEWEAQKHAYWSFERTHQPERTIQDMVQNLVKYGSFSEKQLAFVRSLLQRISGRPAMQAKRAAENAAAADCPVGRIVITGTVLSLRTDETNYGPITKMLVKADSGFKVWGTRSGNFEVGDRVEFKATVERSNTDPKFGFFKRPINGIVLEHAVQTA